MTEQLVHAIPKPNRVSSMKSDQVLPAVADEQV